MIIHIFSLIIAVQLLSSASAFYLKKKELGIFISASSAVTVFILLILEAKPHHYLKNYYGISNTIFYLISLILLTAFFWFFRKNINQKQFLFLFMAAFLWILSGSIDLLADRRILYFASDSAETALLIAGSISYLIFYLLILIQNRLIRRVNKYE